MFVCYFEIGLSVVNLVFGFDLIQSSVCSRACALFSLPKIMFPILFSFLFSSPLLSSVEKTRHFSIFVRAFLVLREFLWILCDIMFTCILIILLIISVLVIY